MNYQSTTTLIKNFILLAYADIFNERKYDMIGTTKNSNELVIHSYSFEKKVYEQVFKYEFKEPIYSVTPGNFTGNGKTSLVITRVEGDHFINSWMEFPEDKNPIKNYRIEDLKSSDHPPMAITDYNTAMPAIVLGHKNKITFYTYDMTNKKMVSDSTFKLDGDLCKDHPYSFVDLDGDLKAELVVVLEKDNKKVLHVYKHVLGAFKKTFSLNLPDGEIGPILFGDFTHKGLNSMVFIHKTNNNEYFLNFFINNFYRNNPEFYKDSAFSVDVNTQLPEIFSYSKDNYIKMPFNDIAPGCTPILKIDFSDNESEPNKSIPGGIFCTDINLDGYLELFIVAKNNQNKDVIVPLRLNDSLDQFKIYSKVKNFCNPENVKSFSTIDYDNRGKENIIINRRSEGDIIVEEYYNILNNNNMKLGFTTTLKNSKDHSYGMGLPGTAYLLIANNSQQLFYTCNFGPGPFLSLTSQTTLIGLGDSTYMIDMLKIGLPAALNEYKGLYIISSSIIQNFDLIISAEKNGKYKVEAFFKIVTYFMKIVYVLITVGVANAIALVVILYNQTKKINLARTKDSMHPLFRSL